MAVLPDPVCLRIHGWAFLPLPVSAMIRLALPEPMQQGSPEFNLMDFQECHLPAGVTAFSLHAD